MPFKLYIYLGAFVTYCDPILVSTENSETQELTVVLLFLGHSHEYVPARNGGGTDHEETRKENEKGEYNRISISRCRISRSL